jgi:hypothetical protein
MRRHGRSPRPAPAPARRVRLLRRPELPPRRRLPLKGEICWTQPRPIGWVLPRVHRGQGCKEEDQQS